MLDQDYENIDQDWSDLDQALLPNFDSDSGSELIDDEADTIFECKKPQFEYSECLLFDDLHWLNDLDELDKTLDNYKNRTQVKINPVDTEFTIYQQPAPVQGGYKYKRKKPPVTTKRAAARQSHWNLCVHLCAHFLHFLRVTILSTKVQKWVICLCGVCLSVFS